MEQVIESEEAQRQLIVSGLHDLIAFIEDNPHFPVDQLSMEVNLDLRPEEMPTIFADRSAVYVGWEPCEYERRIDVTPSLRRWTWEKREGLRAFFGNGQIKLQWTTAVK